MSAGIRGKVVAGNGAGGDAARELTAAVRLLIPVLLALSVGGLILLVLGKDPLTYYGYVVKRGLLSWGGLQETLTRMAPLLLIAAGLIVAFRAGIWNLGGDGQFLLAAVVTAALGPALIEVLPRGVTLALCMIVAMLVGEPVVADPGRSQGSLWGERDHHVADDEFSGDQLRQCAGETGFPRPHDDGATNPRTSGSRSPAAHL